MVKMTRIRGMGQRLVDCGICIIVRNTVEDLRAKVGLLSFH